MPNPNPPTKQLIPFKKGTSGNPKGKPKGTLSLKTLLIDFLNSKGTDQKEFYKDLLIKRVGKLSIVDGNEQMIKLIWNYIEGMPKESSDVNVNVGIQKVSEEYKQLIEKLANAHK